MGSSMEGPDAAKVVAGVSVVARAAAAPTARREAMRVFRTVVVVLVVIG
jgi:hypothetical protein